MENQLNGYTAFLLGLIASLIIGKLIIKKLHNLKYGQSIREEGPQSHFKKNGTPTMGGIIFLLSFMIVILVNNNYNCNLLIIIIGTYGLAIIGFVDDYKIIKLKTNEGISAKEKIIGQLIVGLFVSVLGYYFLGSDIFIPFININFELKLWYIPINILFVIALTNSVNLTDGLDGLSTTITIIVASFFLIVSIVFNQSFMIIVTSSLIGVLFGFLYYNWNPAKIFMGDVGSLALGGMVATIAIIFKLQLIVPFIGVIYLLETMSVIIQVSYFKKYKKRVFKMAPIHHHYELCGLSEKRIVLKFVLITVIGFIISLFILFL
jgi:phospho-N-acetylmuramoyl-pentapeptide-transferase